uniref:Uncharacterized protein n=1 Tax=Tetranychus urticae TaxID=32264 RepID=T1KQJ3_TETUR
MKQYFEVFSSLASIGYLFGKLFLFSR